MDKITKRVEIGDLMSFDTERWNNNPTTINEVLQWLNQMKDQGATHINWWAEVDDDDSTTCDEINARAYFFYEESDEDYMLRKAAEQQAADLRAAQSLQTERATYERLKKKFEKE